VDDNGREEGVALIATTGVDLLEIEDVPKAAIDLAQLHHWCLAGLFGQITLVECDHGGDVHDRVFG